MPVQSTPSPSYTDDASTTVGIARKTVAILQSNYIPWKGYFDLIKAVDEFILLDDAQFTRRDWRNRNKIKTRNGPAWLTIPVRVKGRYHQQIKETVISDPSWNRRHWNSIVHSYARTAYFPAYRSFFEELYLGCRERLLSRVNYRFLTAICELLAIHSKISWSMEYELHGDKTERLLGLCKQSGATDYLSGPAAKAYLNESLFDQEGIAIHWMDYSGYPEYRQLFPPFEHKVSVLDLLLHTGAEAGAHMCYARRHDGMKQTQHTRAYA